MTAETRRILATAADLLGPVADAPNVHPEYHRAIVELTADLLGLGTDELRPPVEAMLGALR